MQGGGTQRKDQSRSSSVLYKIYNKQDATLCDLVGMQHEQALGPTGMAVLEQPGLTAANVPNSGTPENMMPFITQVHTVCQGTTRHI